jgi:hypothetical protein
MERGLQKAPCLCGHVAGKIQMDWGLPSFLSHRKSLTALAVVKVLERKTEMRNR